MQSLLSGSYTKDMTYEQLLADRKTREAIILNFVVIGEAIKKIPQEIIDRHPDVPWKEFAGMRDKMVHGYFMIKPDDHLGDEPARSRTACGCGEGAAPGICVSGFHPCRFPTERYGKRLLKRRIQTPSLQ